mmetsp:Transcript_36812/g.33037  ORF Transcript_36812/g.33037 Transcript_36812/m.33037 type:complete len:111 (+) Transcript_36812:105-437(+)
MINVAQGQPAFFSVKNMANLKRLGLEFGNYIINKFEDLCPNSTVEHISWQFEKNSLKVDISHLAMYFAQFKDSLRSLELNLDANSFVDTTNAIQFLEVLKHTKNLESFTI